MQITEFFKNIGLDSKEAKILSNLLQLGVQPASIIAKHSDLDRTTTYRLLNNLYKKGLLTRAKNQGITVFYLHKLSDIAQYLERQQNRFLRLQEEFQKLLPQLNALRTNIQALPRIQIYEGFEKLPIFFKEIIERTLEQKIIQIRILGSNTFSQKLEQKELGTLIKDFQKDLKQNHIHANILIAQGNLTREWLESLKSFEEMTRLPAAGGATNVILVGDSVFTVSFRDFPVGIRIDHPDIAQTMHFLFDMAGKKI